MAVLPLLLVCSAPKIRPTCLRPEHREHSSALPVLHPAADTDTPIVFVHHSSRKPQTQASSDVFFSSVEGLKNLLYMMWADAATSIAHTDAYTVSARIPPISRCSHPHANSTAHLSVCIDGVDKQVGEHLRCRKMFSGSSELVLLPQLTAYGEEGVQDLRLWKML
jgi:hypothetical protein